MIRNLSVRHKLTAFAVVTTTIVLVLATALFVNFETTHSRRSLERELTAIADVTAGTSTSAIISADRFAAHTTLVNATDRPDIVFAAIYTSDGRLLASHLSGETHDHPTRLSGYGQVPNVIRLNNEHQSERAAHGSLSRGQRYDLGWANDSVDLYGPIILDGNVIGAIHIRSSLDRFNKANEAYLSGVLIIVMFAIALAWLLAVLLRNQITGPIFDLLDTVQLISRSQNYSFRAEKRCNDELGALVDGFNAMLAVTEAHGNELEAAQEEADSANRLKSQFLAQMSHELRTPLNAIMGFSDFMLSEPHGPLGHEDYFAYLRDIHGGGQHLLNVINDILDLSKIEAGDAKLSEEVLVPEEMVSDCVRILRERADKAGIELHAEVSPALPHLYGDGKLLQRGLLNLLSNALKFTPSGGRITLRADQEPSGAIALTVIDNGIGIAPEKLEHVLTPFGQAEKVMTRAQDGTGLGLPLVKSFIELHGGRLDLRSALGEGTKVTLLFPVERTRAKSVVDFPTVGKTVAANGAPTLELSA